MPVGQRGGALYHGRSSLDSGHEKHDPELERGAGDSISCTPALPGVAHYYQIPMFSTAGCTDSKAVDEQAAIEAASSIMAAALSGANLVHDCGYMEYGATSSLELLVMDDEIIGHVRRVVEGIKVDEETLAVDVIKAVGPGAQFLTHTHTFEHFRKETWMPSLISRQRYDHWLEDGSPTLRQRVNARVREIS